MNDSLGKSGFQLILLVMLGILAYVFLNFTKNHLLQYISKSKNSPYIFKGNKDAKRSLVISQNPRLSSSIPLHRSHGRNDAEFSYSLWFIIQDTEYKYGEWKHIFHKGNDSAFPLRAPGLYIHPTENKLRVYMNTLNNILEYVDIPNIPVRKWMHISIVLSGKNLNIYINGKLRTKKSFETVPRQNYGNLWVNLFGGFEGYLSKMRYFNYALSFNDVESIVREGPSKTSCPDSGELPPYLEDKWWYDI